MYAGISASELENWTRGSADRTTLAVEIIFGHEALGSVALSAIAVIQRLGGSEAATKESARGVCKKRTSLERSHQRQARTKASSDEVRR